MHFLPHKTLHVISCTLKLANFIRGFSNDQSVLRRVVIFWGLFQENVNSTSTVRFR